MSELKVNKISPATGTAFALGDSGDTFTVPSGATIVNSGTATGFGGGGKIGQVLQAVKTDTSSITTSAYSDISGLSVAITPAATTSKILVLVDVKTTGDDSIHSVMLVRGSTEIYKAAAAGGSAKVSSGPVYTSNASNMQGIPLIYLDSPSTTSATTYKLQLSVDSAGGNQAYVNRSRLDGASATRCASSITVMEILA